MKSKFYPPIPKLSRVSFKTLLSILLFISIKALAQNAYISNSTSNDVSVINTATNAVITTIPVGQRPYGVAVGYDGSKAYVANYNSSTVSVINTATNTVVATISIGSGVAPFGVAGSPDNSRVYVTNVNGVSVINAATNTVITTISVGAGANPFSVVVSPDNSRVYTANSTANTVSVINTATNTVIATIPVGSYPAYGLAITPDGSTLYVANQQSGSVSVINTATNSVITTIAIARPNGIAISNDGNTVYVSNSNAASISVINRATNTVATTIPVGTSPYGISVSTDNSKVYVVNSGSNNVSVISPATNSVIATVPVGTNPQTTGVFIKSGYVALPLTLTKVKAYQESTSIVVGWTNSTENNVSGYEIEKSLDGIQFIKATTVGAKANNNAAVAYSWLDSSPGAGDNFYRIKAIDVSGNVKYSPIVKVSIKKGKSEIIAYPNPLTTDIINIQFVNQVAGDYTIKLVNALGQTVYKTEIQHRGGSATQSIQLANKPPKGFYQMSIISELVKKSLQVVVD